jgi:sporulation protein YunB
MKMVASQPRKMRLSRKFLRWTVIVVLLLTAAFLVLENNISQVILDRAYANAYSLAVKVINSAVADVMHTGITYEDLITVHLSDQGQVTMLQANTIRMNELATMAALQAQEKLQEENNQVIQIPLGAALGINFLAGSGPNISVRILPVGAVSTQFITEFESAGINQTRHKILLSAKTTVRLVIPTGAKQVELVSNIPIAESIIVGAVPDTFVDVNDKGDILNLIP